MEISSRLNAPWQRGAGGKVAGLQQAPPSRAWKEAFNCLVVKCVWLSTGVEQAVETPTPRCLGLAVHQCRTIRHLMNAEVYTLPRARVNFKIHPFDVTLHLAGQGAGGDCFFLEVTGGRQMGLRTERNQGWCLSVTCTYGDWERVMLPGHGEGVASLCHN